MFSAVVFTPGRSGSHLITKNLSSYFKSPLRMHNDADYTYGIVHSHNPLYKPPTDDFVCIINKRKNEFDAIVSMILTKRTGEFIYYTNKDIDKFSVSATEFQETYTYYKSFYHAINQSYFKQIIEIYYEDLINDKKYLFSTLGINCDTEYMIQKSPYDYYKLVENISELRDLYNQLELTPITLEEIETFKNNIESDLIDIKINHNGNRKNIA
jgi:hypothetical protein